MSILQEYSIIRKQIGEKRYSRIKEYLSKRPNLFLSDIYYKQSEFEVFEVWERQNYPNDNSKLPRNPNFTDEFEEICKQ